ncbi:hypothetical protein C2G38_2060646 [Gigaspora rosea]|uniref:Uncharacterized protein n=1 Tax=Gigaspora rosea TaxID=44941 RepID=A0A397W924_9GLOM|nr:hypothetical protein C2G38_2060646 [Gigaspora rosea]
MLLKPFLLKLYSFLPILLTLRLGILCKSLFSFIFLIFEYLCLTLVPLYFRCFTDST